MDSMILVQGGSLRTWSYRSPAVEQVQVVLGTEGRPLDADIELWHGPDNTPVKMRVYCENGQLRPFSAVIETPRGPNTVAIRNIGQIEFPIAANVVADDVDLPSPDAHSMSTTVQGGALRTYPFDPTVDSVEVLIKTDGRPLNARIELLQGPNNNKQVLPHHAAAPHLFVQPADTGGAAQEVCVLFSRNSILFSPFSPKSVKLISESNSGAIIRSSSCTRRTAATGHSSASSRPPELATWSGS